LFWIPRNLESMPAFTSNIEFGEFLHSGKIILGYPETAHKMRYLKERCIMHDVQYFHTMEEVANCAIKESNFLFNLHKALKK